MYGYSFERQVYYYDIREKNMIPMAQDAFGGNPVPMPAAARGAPPFAPQAPESPQESS